MKNGWVKRSIDDICVFRGGGTPSKSKESYWKGDIPWVSPKDMKSDIVADSIDHISAEAIEQSSTNLIAAGSILVVVRSGILARTIPVAITGRDVTINQDIKALCPDSTIDAWFLFYFLKSRLEEMLSLASRGATVHRIMADQIRTMEILVPPLPEQRRIVGILDEAFDGIATVKANVEKNLQNACELFHSALNAGITGELTREWRLVHRNDESAAEHLKQALAKRRNQWKGTGKYVEPQVPVSNRPIDIPTSWAMASPEQLSTHIIDCPHSTPKWTESGVLCLRTTNFKPGFLDLEAVQYVAEETYCERVMRLEPKPGDVLYSREGGILGIACLLPEGLRACLGQRMMQFRLDVKVALPEFFTSVLNSTPILSEVKRLTGGAASPHLNIRDIRTFPIPLPPIGEQREIVKKLDTISAETQRLESLYQRKLAALDELKKSLLHQAFSGEL